jgi:RNA polymerase sigma factor (TIGR02999 family)
VHEAYLRLFRHAQANYDNRAHFFAAFAEAMRRILVERARRRRQVKRGGGRVRVDFDDLPDAVGRRDPDPAGLLAVHEALSRLEAFDRRAANIVKLRCFVGMNIAEVAQALDLTSRTVNRDWQVARAWLKRELAPNASDAPRAAPCAVASASEPD